MFENSRFSALRLSLFGLVTLLLGACQQDVGSPDAHPSNQPLRQRELQRETPAPSLAELKVPNVAKKVMPDPEAADTPVEVIIPRPLDLSPPERPFRPLELGKGFATTETALLPRLFGKKKKKKSKGVSLSVKPLLDEDVEGYIDAVEGAEFRVKIVTD